MFENDDFYREKFFCINKKDVLKSLNGGELQQLYSILDKITDTVGMKKYLVVNQDEPYADKIWQIIKEAETKEIVAFVGVAGSGKDYQCALLEKRGFIDVAFADALRNIAYEALCIDKDTGKRLYDGLKSNDCIHIDLHRLDSNLDSYNITFRKFLEKLGTEGIRKFDNDFWCRAVVNTIKENNYKKVCISDMRFYNEYKWLRNFANENDYKFKVIFCDYHSDRYDYNNSHPSAKLANFFVDYNYKDLQELTEEDFERFLREKGE